MATCKQTKDHSTLPDSFDDFELSEDTINPWKQFHGAWIPLWLLEKKEISSDAKITYALIAKMAGEKGYCWPTQETLSVQSGMARTRALRALNELRHVKLIKSVRRGLQKSNLYFFLKHDWMKFDRIEPDDIDYINDDLPF